MYQQYQALSIAEGPTWAWPVMVLRQWALQEEGTAEAKAQSGHVEYLQNNRNSNSSQFLVVHQILCQMLVIYRMDPLSFHSLPHFRWGQHGSPGQRRGKWAQGCEVT